MYTGGDMRSSEGFWLPDPELMPRQEEICGWFYDLDAVEFEEQTELKFQRIARAQGKEPPSAWVKVKAEMLCRREDKKAENVVAAELADMIKEYFHETSEELPFDAVVGVPSGATPFADKLASKLSFDGDKKVYGTVQVRKNGDTFSVDNVPVEKRPVRVVVVEDVMTTGASSAEMIRVLQRAGYEVVLVVALVNREQGGPERFAQMQPPIPVLWSVTITQLLAWGFKNRPAAGNYKQAVEGEQEVQRYLSQNPS